MNRLRFTLACAASVYALTAGVAAAQGQAQAAPADQAPSTSTVQEIIVTAQHRQENAQSVPVAISVVGASQIAASNFRAVTDLQYIAPSVQFDPTNGGSFQIRGIGKTSYDFSVEAGVNVVVDGVVMDLPKDPGLIGLSDIDRIEVLRGPQGTLFGKNSTSGVISIVTKAPVLNQTSASLSVSYGERNDRDTTAIVNLPLSEDAALRLSAFEQGQSGYGTNENLKEKIGGYQESGERAKLLWRPTDSLEVQVSADYEHHFDANTQTLQTATPTYAAGLATFGIVAGPNNVNTADPFETSNDVSDYGGSVQAAYKMFGLTLTSITAVREQTYTGELPVDFIPSPLFLPEDTGARTYHKISQEFRLASPTGQFLEYTAGLFYNRLTMHQTIRQWGQVSTALPPNTLISLTGKPGTSTNQDIFDGVDEGIAAYGQAKLNFTKQFNIAFGGRYTHDDNSQTLSFATIPTSFILINAAKTPSQPGGSVTGDNFSYTITPQYRFSPNLMVYATYGTGYKGPGVAFVSQIYDPFKAETVVAYEAGIKSDLFDRRLRLNADVFDEQHKNFQTQTFVQQAVGPGVFVTGNAGGLRSRGVEADLEARPAEPLDITASFTYDEAVFTNYIDGTNNYTGQRLTNAPKYAWTVGANYHRSIGRGLLFTANGNYAWRSDTYGVIGDKSTFIPSYGIFTSRLGVGPQSGVWQVGIYARNLFNQHFSTGFTNFTTSGIGLVRSSSPEGFRTIGVYFKGSI